MTRKDEKDTERPHYYSQFWLDVAAGRREIGGGASKADENADADDMPEPITPARKGGRAAVAALVDGHRNSRPRDFDEEDLAANETLETGDYGDLDMEEDELAGNLEDEDIPNILVDSPAGETLVDIDLPLAEEEALDDEEYFDEEEDEEEEDDWSARGRKKPKPGRQVKAPKPSTKKPKRGGRTY